MSRLVPIPLLSDWNLLALKVKSTIRQNDHVIDGTKTGTRQAKKPGPVVSAGLKELANLLTNFKLIIAFWQQSPLHRQNVVGVTSDDVPKHHYDNRTRRWYSVVAIARVVCVDNTTPLTPPPSPTARSLDSGTPHHGSLNPIQHSNSYPHSFTRHTTSRNLSPHPICTSTEPKCWTWALSSIHS
jgi:hypothetical protein